VLCSAAAAQLRFDRIVEDGFQSSSSAGARKAGTVFICCSSNGAAAGGQEARSGFNS
jgi:hypothetical protein